MIAPTAQMIEQAKDMLTDPDFIALHSKILDAQEKELHAACDAVSNDFKSGFELGMQTARVLVAGMPGAIMAKVSI